MPMLDEEKKAAGYIKLWRCLCGDEIWLNMPYSPGKLWLWLLMEAAHKGNAEKRHLDPGQLDHSIRFICTALAWEHPEKHRLITPSQPTILKDLKALEGKEMITRTAISRVKAIISICNWKDYQENEPEGNSTDKSSGKSSGKSKLKNVKNVLEVPPPPQPPSKEQRDFAVVEFSKDTSPDDFEPTDPDYQAIPGYNAAEEISYWEAHIKKIPRNLRLLSQNAFIQLHQHFKLSLPQLQSLLTHLATDPEAKGFWGDVPTRLIVQRSDGLFSFQKAQNHMERSNDNPKESRHGNRNGRSPQGIGCTFGGMLDKYLTEDAQQEGAYVDVSPDSGELPALGPASGQ